MHSDYRLIRKIKKKNDRNSANELVSRYYDEIYIYVYKQLQEKELAMDMTQDIFIAVLKGLHSYDEKKASFRTWLYRLASNKIMYGYLLIGNKMKIIYDVYRPILICISFTIIGLIIAVALAKYEKKKDVVIC